MSDTHRIGTLGTTRDNAPTNRLRAAYDYPVVVLTAARLSLPRRAALRLSLNLADVATALHSWAWRD